MTVHINVRLPIISSIIYLYTCRRKSTYMHIHTKPMFKKVLEHPSASTCSTLVRVSQHGAYKGQYLTDSEQRKKCESERSCSAQASGKSAAIAKSFCFKVQSALERSRHRFPITARHFCIGNNWPNIIRMLRMYSPRL